MSTKVGKQMIKVAAIVTFASISFAGMQVMIWLPIANAMMGVK